MPSTVRFFRQFLRPDPGAVTREDVTYRRGEETLPASLYVPRGGGLRAGARRGSALPGWMALHGLTYHGREHPSLDRFVRALAASGAVVLVPDLPEWRALRVAPETTVATIRAAVLELDRSPLTAAGRIGAIGFSFGATQALIASTDADLDGHLAGVAAWGGYHDLARTGRFMFLGEHELDGARYRSEPDPYGRWILAGNYLTLLPEHRGDGALADALRGLALEAGRRGIMSWDPATDPLKAAARAQLTRRQKEVFDLLAPPAENPLSEAQQSTVEALVERMTGAAVAKDPLLDPRPYLDRVPVPVFLAHGHNDRLMPWTEMVRLQRALPPDLVAHAAITRLFSHSFGEKRVPTPAVVLEALRFVRTIHRMIRLV